MSSPFFSTTTCFDSSNRHRVLSNVFMEMPSKKDYPMYYTQIKRPMCIETIFVSHTYFDSGVCSRHHQKHLKRKEYQTSLDFANDVELVFSNALEFNQDHSQIWEDAIILRVSIECPGQYSYSYVNRITSVNSCLTCQSRTRYRSTQSLQQRSN